MPPRFQAGASRLRLSLSDSKISNAGITLIYAGGLVVWMILTLFMGLWPQTSKTTKLFLILPIIVCLTNMITPIPGSDIILDPQVEQSNLLSYILIGGSILSPWLSSVIDRRRKNHVRIIKTFIIMLLCLTLTQYNLFSLRYVSDLETHWVTILNTYALSLLGFAISEFMHIEYSPFDGTWGADKSTVQRNANRMTLLTGAQLSQIS